MGDGAKRVWSMGGGRTALVDPHGKRRYVKAASVDSVDQSVDSIDQSDVPAGSDEEEYEYDMRRTWPLVARRS